MHMRFSFRMSVSLTVNLPSFEKEVLGVYIISGHPLRNMKCSGGLRSLLPDVGFLSG